MSETPETETGAAVTPARAPGEVLRQAREGKNLSVAAIATQLNLDLRTIEALERGDHDKLPAPIFVRGYLRGYARLVGVPEDAVLGAYRAQAPQPEPAPPAVGRRSAQLRPAYREPRMPWRALLLALLFAGAALLAIVYGPQLLTPFLAEDGAAPDGAPQLSLPSLGGEGGTGAVSVPEPVSGGLELPLPAPLPVPAEEPPPADAGPEPDLPDEGDFGSATATPPLAAAPAGPETAAVVAPAVPLAADQVRLDFRFGEDSWVEVRAADRSRLLFGLMRRGESRSVTGKAPVSVVLGNAATVELQVNGNRLDLAPHTRNNIARLDVRAAN